MPSKQVVLFRVRSGSTTIGCLYGHVENGRLLQYQSGFARSGDSKVKVGLVTHAMCIKSAAERGFRAYDLLAGDSRYKRELSNSQQELVWVTLWAATARGQALHLAHHVRRRLAKHAS